MTDGDTGAGRRVLETGPAAGSIANVPRALRDLLDQEFHYSSGHLAAILNGCLFAPSLLTFWFVNGAIDFSSAIAIGAVESAAGLQVRLIAYLLLVPTFLLARAALHLAHPRHRAQVLSGSCPHVKLLSLDWISMGILATGLPLALRNLGPWVSMNLVFLLGIFVLPRALSGRRATGLKLAAIVAGSVLFLYANYGGAVGALPDPAATVGPAATLTLGESTTLGLSRAANSLIVGPPLIAAVAVGFNHVLTRPEIADLPLVRYSLPERDPDRLVAGSAALGTWFFLAVVWGTTGSMILLP